MTPRSTSWKYWLVLGVLVVLTAMLAVAWQLGHRAQSEELRVLEARIEALSSQGSDEAIRGQNNDLVLFIDEAYTLLHEAGIHIQLDIKTDEEGRIRLSADSAKLTEELKAKLQELNQQVESSRNDN